MSLLLPLLIPMIGALLTAAAGRTSGPSDGPAPAHSGRRLISILAVAATALTFGVTVLIFVSTLTGQGGQSAGYGTLAMPGFLGMGLTLNIHGLHGIFACVAAYMWMMTTLYSDEYMAHSGHLTRYYLFLLLSQSATMGVFLANDLFTSFVFFEIMSFTSYVCVVHNEDSGAVRAGNVYLAVVTIGGMVSLMGLFLLYDLTGTLAFSELLPACRDIIAEGGREAARLRVFAVCILVGYGSKAGLYPLHIWLPLAHPVAPAPASALLSGIITKTGLFGLIALSVYVFEGSSAFGFVIVILGTLTMFHGGTIALFSTDIKRTLACSSISQLGMITLGIGMQCLLGDESSIALRGAISHMFNHSNLKLVLFMSAGVIAMDIHKLGLNEIRGYGRKKPLLKAIFLIGALGIAGVPLFNGYVSKTLLHESIVEYLAVINGGAAGLFGMSAGMTSAVFRLIEWLFLLTGGLTVSYMTKLFICVFVERNADEKVQAYFDSHNRVGSYMDRLTAAVLTVSAALLPVLGLLPHHTMDRIAELGQQVVFGTSASAAAEEAAHHAHIVQYFSGENLKGAVISICLGTVLYMLSRRFLMSGDSEKRYLNKWPAALDLITLIYEPLFINWIPAALGAVFNVADQSTDSLLKLLRNTVLRDRKEILRPRVPLTAPEDPSTRIITPDHSKKNIRRFSRLSIMATAAYSLLLFGLGMMITILYVLR